MKKLTGSEIRSLFLEYFKSKDHMVEPGASLVPVDDPTLLWINSGVAALKKYFDGTQRPQNPRITNAQKSIRTNDIENVGKTARHHTFFEMLGNFSIGDYFKNEAIPFAWEFLTDDKWIGFDKDKMYVTIHPSDTEAYRIWTEVIGLDPKRILKTEYNYWQIGEGPSGPNTEIFYDRGPKYDPEGLGERLFFEEMENDRYIEVWNVVFSQYDAKEGVDRSEFKELPSKNIDTGMGLERLTCIVQDVETNFDTDLFMPIIDATQNLAKHKYENEYKMAYRVIADHIRTVTFALADGAMFSNEGRGYVLRRLLRRAVRYGKKIGIEKSFMYQLVAVVTKNMSDFYPYLLEKEDYVSKMVKIEEDRFHQTLADGEKMMLELFEKAPNKMISGEDAFKMYDTYGFPFELTLEMANERGYEVDEAKFKACMEEQRQRARDAREDNESMSSQSKDLLDFKDVSEFVGYTTLSNTAKIIGLFKNGTKVTEINDSGEIVVDSTCFYAESGGQVADTGLIEGKNGVALVNNVKKAPHKQHLHFVEVEKGNFKLGDEVTLVVNSQRRDNIAQNHSVTHLLQKALQEVLGDHISQAGSYVCDEYMRFDFTHFEKMNEEQMLLVERKVNEAIYSGLKVEVANMPIEEAKAKGAMALFSEKYGDVVRVVSMGDYSIELCGGTHVNNTSSIGVFKILSEESIGSGVRRITGTTRMKAYESFKQEEKLLANICGKLKITSIDSILSKLDSLADEISEMKLENSKLKAQLNQAKANDLLNNVEMINGIKCLIAKMEGADANALKAVVDKLRAENDSILVFLASVVDSKVVFVCGMTQDLVKSKLNAGALVKLAATTCLGNGGGRPDMAQAGGKDVSKVDEALELVKTSIGK